LSASASTKKLDTFIKSLAKSHKADEPYEALSPINELIYSFLLWETSSSKANTAFKKLTTTFVDLNELRVTEAEDLADLLGKQYPRADERIQRLLAALNDVYRREHAVGIASCLELSKRDGRKYLETIEGIAPFISARMTLVVLGAHAVPIDDRMLQGMIADDLFDEDAQTADAISAFERAVRASDSMGVYESLQTWSDSGAAPLGIGGGKKSSSKTSKKKTTRKASRPS